MSDQTGYIVAALRVGAELIAILGILSLSFPFIYRALRRRKKSDRSQRELEAGILRELREVEEISRELWDTLGPERYHQLVYFYARRRETFVRANCIFEFWNSVGRMYAQRRVNRRRLLAQIAPKCHGYWLDYADLIAHLAQTEPERIADFRRLHAIAEKYIERTRREIQRIRPGKAA